MTDIPRLGRIIGLLALAALLAACSAVKLGYNNLGEIAYWWLDSHVEFSDEQAARVRDDLTRLHQWHRSHELPQLAQMLRRMEEIAPGDISPAQACAFVTQLRERLRITAEQAEPAIVTRVMSLAPDQLRHLERKYARNNAKYQDEWVRLPAADVAAKRFDQFLDRMETVYGTLDARQRDLLRGQMDQSIFDPRRVGAERRQRQQDALQTARKLAGQPVSFGEARSLVRGYLARVQEPHDAGHRRYQQALIDEGCRTFSLVHNSTNAAQREAAVRRLRAYQRDLNELASHQ